MVFEKPYTTKMEDCQLTGLLSPEGLLRILMNTCDQAMEAIGDGPVTDARSGEGWVVADWRCIIYRMPRHTETLQIRSWLTDIGKETHAIRNYHILDSNGGELMRVTSTFVRFDVPNQKAIPIPPELLAMYEPEGPLLIEGPMRLYPPEHPTNEVFVPQRRCDIDFNGHVHNVPYLTYALEAIPKDIYLRNHYKGIRIFYKRPLQEGEVVRVVCEEVEPPEAALPETETAFRLAIYGEGDALSTVLELDIGD